MQDMVIILSRCRKKLKLKSEETYSNIFSFNGYYQGEKIKEIRLSDCVQGAYFVGRLYLIWVKRERVSNQQLIGHSIKFKLID